jgi:Cdc6-like AAA superfamily ATPase
MSAEYKKLYEHYHNAKLIHDRWEVEYLKGMDFEMANEITNNLIEEVIKGKLDKVAKETHRFSGAPTPQGNVSYYGVLTQDIKNLYIVKGRPGSGKSTMSKKVAKAALEAGYDVEYYHCAFDPNSIDMVLIPELSFAMLDGTAPHVVDPRPQDHLIDMFKCIDTNIVHEDEDPIKGIEQEYADEINKAKAVYTRIKDLHDEVEKYYIEATDYEGVNALTARIRKELLGSK